MIAASNIFNKAKEAPPYIFSEEHIAALEAQAVSHNKGNNSYIYYSDDSAHHIFILVKGRVKIGARSKDDKEIIKEIIYPGEIFGESVLTGNGKRCNFALTMDKDTKYLAISLPILKDLIKDNPEFGMRIMTQVGNKLRTMEKRLESVIFKNSRSRIIDFLKDRADTKGIPIGYEILLKHRLTHQDIANLTSTSRQTVTTVLNDLKKKDIIHTYRKNILIRDLNLLQ